MATVWASPRVGGRDVAGDSLKRERESESIRKHNEANGTRLFFIRSRLSAFEKGIAALRKQSKAIN